MEVSINTDVVRDKFDNRWLSMWKLGNNWSLECCEIIDGERKIRLSIDETTEGWEIINDVMEG